MPVDRMYQGDEPLPHPLTGDPIPLDDKDALFKAWIAAEDELRKTSARTREIRKAADALVYAMAGRDVTLHAARDFARANHHDQ